MFYTLALQHLNPDDNLGYDVQRDATRLWGRVVETAFLLAPSSKVRERRTRECEARIYETGDGHCPHCKDVGSKIRSLSATVDRSAIRLASRRRTLRSFCEFAIVCPSFDDGSNVDGLIDEFYVPRQRQ